MNARGQRIYDNCKRIWGAEKDFEIDIETDDWEYYSCHVREDYGDSFGPVLTMTTLCDGPDRAWNELDRMLRLWAQQVESGRPITREENLNIFSGPQGQFRYLLETCMDEKAAFDAKAATKQT